MQNCFVRAAWACVQTLIAPATVHEIAAEMLFQEH
jgi:hypothetical protein